MMNETMPRSETSHTLRFGPFEADLRELELRKRGIKVKLQGQPFQVLAILLRRAGETVTREELRSEVWPADTFVDFDHSLNTAINKIREVLGDSASSPHYVETIPKRGYRFIAVVEPLAGNNVQPNAAGSVGGSAAAATSETTQSAVLDVDQLPTAERTPVRVIFALVQVMYLLFYVAALFKIERIHRILEDFSPGFAPALQMAVLLTAALAIPTRLYLLSSISFDYRGLGVKFRRIYPALAALDFLWALSPFLMIHVIGIGLAFAATAALLYLPFSQRTLIKMAYS
jgi:DNA-binding winged helix-turn-helix (wHTH) protein